MNGQLNIQTSKPTDWIREELTRCRQRYEAIKQDRYRMLFDMVDATKPERKRLAGDINCLNKCIEADAQIISGYAAELKKRIEAQA